MALIPINQLKGRLRFSSKRHLQVKSFSFLSAKMVITNVLFGYACFTEMVMTLWCMTYSHLKSSVIRLNRTHTILWSYVAFEAASLWFRNEICLSNLWHIHKQGLLMNDFTGEKRIVLCIHEGCNLPVVGLSCLFFVGCL